MEWCGAYAGLNVDRVGATESSQNYYPTASSMHEIDIEGQTRSIFERRLYVRRSSSSGEESLVREWYA